MISLLEKGQRVATVDLDEQTVQSDDQDLLEAAYQVLDESGWDPDSLEILEDYGYEVKKDAT